MEDRKEKLEHLYYDGMLSQREIARSLKVPHPTVQSWLKRYNISCRSRSESLKLHIAKHPEHLIKAKNGSRQAHLGKKQSPELIARRVASRRGYKHSEETRKRIGDANRGKTWSPEQHHLLDPIVTANRNTRPTSLESRLLNLVAKHSLPYKYVGNGHTFIAGRCPDFLHIGRPKRVVEVFSVYWHDPTKNPRVDEKYTEAATLHHYQKYGFDCLIVWEHELDDEESLLERLTTYPRP